MLPFSSYATIFYWSTPSCPIIFHCQYDKYETVSLIFCIKLINTYSNFNYSNSNKSNWALSRNTCCINQHFAAKINTYLTRTRLFIDIIPYCLTDISIYNISILHLPEMFKIQTNGRSPASMQYRLTSCYTCTLTLTRLYNGYPIYTCLNTYHIC